MGAAINTLAFPHPPRQLSANQLRSCRELFMLETETAGKIPAVYFEQPGSRFTLLVTHGNAEDVGQALPSLQHMKQECRVSVFAVEYPGYSISEAEGPSENFCYEAVEAGYRYLTEEKKIPPANVIPYGRSLGSGPAVHVAANHPEIKALVLVSPLESGARAFFGNFVSWVGSAIDPFKNYAKIGKVEAVTCIIHGTADQVVPYQNGRGLYEALQKRGKAADPLWIEGHGHNDLPERSVLRHIKSFLDSVKV